MYFTFSIARMLTTSSRSLPALRIATRIYELNPHLASAAVTVHASQTNNNNNSKKKKTNNTNNNDNMNHNRKTNIIIITYIS